VRVCETKLTNWSLLAATHNTNRTPPAHIESSIPCPPDFSQSTWDAFQQFVVEGCRPADVAREPGLTVNSVIKAKAFVLTWLRQEVGGFLEQGSIFRGLFPRLRAFLFCGEWKLATGPKHTHRDHGP
jgi:hypothetical protein